MSKGPETGTNEGKELLPPFEPRKSKLFKKGKGKGDNNYISIILNPTADAETRTKADEEIRELLQADYNALGELPDKKAAEEKRILYAQHAEYLDAQIQAQPHNTVLQGLLDLFKGAVSNLQERIDSITDTEPEPAPEVKPDTKRAEETLATAERLENFGQLSFFLVNKLNLPTIEFQENTRSATIDITRQILRESLDAGRRAGGFGLVRARDRILKLEAELDGAYGFSGKLKDGDMQPDVTIGQKIKEQPNKAEKIELLKEMYAVFTEVLRDAARETEDAREGKKQPRQKKGPKPPVEQVKNPESVKKVSEAVDRFLDRGTMKHTPDDEVNFVQELTGRLNTLSNALNDELTVILEQKIPAIEKLKKELDEVYMPVIAGEIRTKMEAGVDQASLRSLTIYKRAIELLHILLRGGSINKDDRIRGGNVVNIATAEALLAAAEPSEAERLSRKQLQQRGENGDLTNEWGNPKKFDAPNESKGSAYEANRIAEATREHVKQEKKGAQKNFNPDKIQSIDDIDALIENLAKIPRDKIALINLEDTINVMLLAQLRKLENTKDPREKDTKIKSTVKKVEIIVNKMHHMAAGADARAFVGNVKNQLIDFKKDIEALVVVADPKQEAKNQGGKKKESFVLTDIDSIDNIIKDINAISDNPMHIAAMTASTRVMLREKLSQLEQNNNQRNKARDAETLILKTEAVLRNMNTLTEADMAEVPASVKGFITTISAELLNFKQRVEGEMKEKTPDTKAKLEKLTIKNFDDINTLILRAESIPEDDRDGVTRAEGLVKLMLLKSLQNLAKIRREERKDASETLVLEAQISINNTVTCLNTGELTSPGRILVQFLKTELEEFTEKATEIGKESVKPVEVPKILKNESYFKFKEIDSIDTVLSSIKNKDIDPDSDSITIIKGNIDALIVEKLANLEHFDESRQKLNGKLFTMRVETMLKRIEKIDRPDNDEIAGLIDHIKERITQFKTDVEGVLAGKDVAAEEEAATMMEEPSVGSMIMNMVQESATGTTSPEIENNAEFTAWLARIAERNYKAMSTLNETLEVWYAKYERQREKVTQMRDILVNKKMFPELFSAFSTESEQDFARQRWMENLEWDLIIKPITTEEQLDKILKQKNITEAQAKTIANLETQKKEVMRVFQDKLLTIPGELAFDMMYGADAEEAKLKDLLLFMRDMDNNYLYYHGETLNEGKNDIEKAENRFKMEMLYNKTRNMLQEDDLALNTEGGLGWWTRAKGKLSRWWNPTERNHNDFTGFDQNISMLQELGLVPTETTDQASAKGNMEHMRNAIWIVQDIMKKNNLTSVHDVLNNDAAVVNNNLQNFKKLYETYIKNRSQHSSIQQKAREVGNTGVALQGMQNNIDTAKAQEQVIYNYQKDLILDPLSYNVFTREVKRVALVNELKSLKEALRTNQTLQNLQRTSKRLAEIDPTIATIEVKLLHQQAALELMQANTRFATSFTEQKKEFYDRIFRSDSLTKKQKLQYAKNAKTLLSKTKKLEKNPLRQGTLESLETYFGNQEIALAA